MKIWSAALACGLIVGGGTFVAEGAYAQAASFPDVPANHWAYQAVQDLADKGYVKGYPDGKFLGKRAMTRYEFATVIDRMVQTVSDLSAKVAASANTPPTTPTGTPVTQDDLNKLQSLVDSFRTQLDAIQSQINGDPAKGTVGFQDQLDAIRQDILDTKELLAKTADTANGSYGSGSSRKFQISGYVQARYQQSGNSKDRFPEGSSVKQGAYNGNYAQGGNNESFEVRRARLKFTGALTPNSKYGIQIDTSGAVTSGASANQQVTVREGYIAYTFGDGDANRFPTLTAGQFATPFGYMLPLSTSVMLEPERPLAFSESGVGLFPSQDYDKGVEIGYNTPQQLVFLPAGLKLTAAFINGTARSSEDVDRRIDQVYRVAYQSRDKQFGLGASYYDGQIGAPAAGGRFGRKKQLYGLDAQYFSNAGPFLLGEYVNGKFEQRTAFANFTDLSPTTVYVPGNRIEGYYAQGGYTFGPTGAHPLSLFVSYDKLRRARSGAGSSDAYDDENVGYGALYNLDKATRLRIFYIKPSKVAHDPATAEPPKIAETTAEIQVKF